MLLRREFLLHSSGALVRAVELCIRSLGNYVRLNESTSYEYGVFCFGSGGAALMLSDEEVGGPTLFLLFWLDC